MNTIKPFENRIAGMEKLTMLDFPNKLAAILFYVGCNLRCPYCYNPSVVKNEMGTMDADEIVRFLQQRTGVLDGVVFSGGECTIWGGKLQSDIEYVRSLGYKIKLDTNGLRAGFVTEMINRGLIDYVALDIKCPENGNSHKQFYNKSQNYPFYPTWNLLQFLIKYNIPFETRTTIHPDVTNEEEASLLLKQLAEVGVKKHHFQFFFSIGESLGNVSQAPRYFDVSKVDTHGIELGLRNSNQNDHRKVFDTIKNS